ncbi:nucleoside triphosphate pyrophosphohydrolase [bacterium]|nr:MAG: nucleoside triphosphate pyrophosphohydrolase [bacterium]
MQPARKPTRSFQDLVEIVEILRKECPWDREQSHESLKDLMVEEIYEAIDAIDQKNFPELKKELGDLLLHVVFHAVMADETQSFNMGDVIWGIQEKLIRRHPHVFEQVKVSGTEEVLKNWEQIKMKEGGRKSVLEGVPNQLPGLLRAQRMQEKASGVGFDWGNFEDCWVKVEEELNEFKETIKSQNKEERAKEFGDLIFAMVNAARHLDINSEDALRLTNNKFKSRFQYIEQRVSEQGKQMKELNLQQLDLFWDEAKALEKAGKLNH